eukprot:CAMPEP_0197665674 /NCGR_PEP_ID=MMETSP1338-20131121/60079_1 /TAXON_ID=43686 ORGANISM="Pelagodinium beii, Strain RCC1491" /NCGR_SAMPLE_ID=MMETSP1338 /ASSEMBLY_ACC=CAM_ASM_000754 /LENGTH=332 /DNA_ID=CAMNT_0043244551 /DNA_START=54 /DNA_END=1052 /DNA_ORIENTATION=+
MAADWKVPKAAREMGSASTAMALTSLAFNPFDVVKTKIQTQNQLVSGNLPSAKLYTSARHCMRTLLAEQGFFRGLWLPGLTASVVRDVINGGIRMGLYPSSVKTINDASSSLGLQLPGLGVKILAGWLTGMVGAYAGNPTDIIKIRLQAESGVIENGVYVTGLYKGSMPSYRSAGHAFMEIVRNEGMLGLFRGSSANVARAALVTSAQMSSYDQTKSSLGELSQSSSLLQTLFGNEAVKVAVASFVSGIVAATAAAPADLVRSRVMDDCRADKGESRYAGSADCVRKTIQHQGFFSLWKGWVPAYMRLGPQFMVAFPLMEVLRTKAFGLPPF